MNAQRVNAAVNQVAKAGNQINTAANAAANGQIGNANRSANAAANNLAGANAKLNAEANKARALGNVNMANNLKKAANAARRAEIMKALKHIANAIKSKNNFVNNTIAKPNITVPQA